MDLQSVLPSLPSVAAPALVAVDAAERVLQGDEAEVLEGGERAAVEAGSSETPGSVLSSSPSSPSSPSSSDASLREAAIAAGLLSGQSIGDDEGGLISAAVIASASAAAAAPAPRSLPLGWAGEVAYEPSTTDPLLTAILEKDECVQEEGERTRSSAP
jgi:hypothetical protein